MNDPLGDMLTRIRNAQMRGKTSVVASIKLRRWVLSIAGRLHSRLFGS